MSDTAPKPLPKSAASKPAASPIPAPSEPTISGDGRILWVNVLTVVSASILIGVEVFGAAFAAGWAFAMLFNLGGYGVPILQAIFFVIGLIVMIRFLAHARHIEPFTSRG